MTFDPLLLMRRLGEFDVKYVLIGGLAAQALGSPIVTQDVDVCYQRTPENLEHLTAMLRSVNARLRGVGDDVPFRLDAATLEAGDHFTFVTDAGDFDILGTPAGTNGYDDLVRNADGVDLDGMTVAVAAVDDLIRMKRAAGRPKDRVEIEILGALREELEGRGSG
jgi:hypothetical protein